MKDPLGPAPLAVLVMAGINSAAMACVATVFAFQGEGWMSIVFLVAGVPSAVLTERAWKSRRAVRP